MFEQTLEDIEYIFIDDCSSDCSISLLSEVIAKYPDRQKQVTLLQNEYNLGVGQTRQKGISQASGAYLIHCDPDDWVDRDLYRTMLDCALKNKADIVICNYSYEWGNQTKIVQQQCPETPKEIFNQIVYGKLHCGLCNKLISKDLSTRFPIEPGINMWEDVSICTLMLLSANSVKSIASPFYHYRINTSSITHDNSLTRVNSQINCMNSLTNRLKFYNFEKIIDPIDLSYYHWIALVRLIKSTRIDYYKVWNSTFQEYTRQYRHFKISPLQKLRTQLAIKKYYTTLYILNQSIETMRFLRRILKKIV